MQFRQEQMYYTSQTRICNPIETHKSKLFSLSHTRRNKHRQLRKFFDLLDRTPCKMYHISYLSAFLCQPKGFSPFQVLKEQIFWSDRPQQMLFWRIFSESHQFSVEFYQPSANKPHYLIYSPCLIWRHITRAYGLWATKEGRHLRSLGHALRMYFFDWGTVLSFHWKQLEDI